ncbi:MAG: phage tail tape measure protein [Sarcina sp.]
MGSLNEDIESDNAEIAESENSTTETMETDAREQTGATDEVKQAMSDLKEKAASAMNAMSGELITFGKSAFSAAETFNTAMGKIGTIANVTKVPITKLQKEILALSNSTGVAASTIANDVYKVIASGVSTSESIKIVATASKLASISYNSVSDSMKFLLNVMKGYGIKAKDITKASNDLIVTQKGTKMTFDNTAKAMEGLEGKAKSAGINLATVGASLIALHKSGESSSSSVKNLKIFMSELGKSTSKVNKTLEKTSNRSFKSLNESGTSLYKSLNNLYKQTGGNEKNFKALFKSAKAGNAAWAILKEGSESFTKSLNKMSKASNATGKSWSKAANTAQVSMKKTQASVKNAMMAIGVALVPVVKFITKLINKFAEFAQGVNPQVAKIVAGVGIAIVAFNAVYTNLKTLKEGFKDLWVVMKLDPFMTIITVIVLVGTALYECYQHVAWFRNMVNEAGRDIKSIFLGAMSFIEGFGETWSATWNEVGSIFTNKMSSISSGISRTISEITNTISSFINWVSNSFSSVGREATHIYDSFKSMFFALPNKKLGIKGEHKISHMHSYAPHFIPPVLARVGIEKPKSFMEFGTMNSQSLNNIRGDIGSLGVVESNFNAGINMDGIAEKVVRGVESAVSKMNERYIQTNVILDSKEIARATCKPINTLNGNQFAMNNRRRGIL